MRRSLPVARLALVLVIISTACTSADKKLQELQKNIQGLRATTLAVGDAWVAGDVSSTYAGVALRRTLQLVDEQRASLNATPELLVDARGATLSRQAEQLSRILAVLIKDAAGRSLENARAHLAQFRAGEASP